MERFISDRVFDQCEKVDAQEIQILDEYTALTIPNKEIQEILRQQLQNGSMKVLRHGIAKRCLRLFGMVIRIRSHRK